MLRNRLFLEWLGLFGIACLFAVGALYAGLTDRIDTRILDASTAMARPDPSSDIVIVAIDDASLNELGSWPWPRAVHAQLVDNLRQRGVKQIIYDVLFLERTNEEDDGRLAASISQAGNVILPFTFGNISDEGEVGPVYPIKPLADAAQTMGHVSANPDPDGVLRRFALQTQDGPIRYTHMSLAAVEAARDGDAKITDKEPWPIVPFNPPGSFVTAPASTIVNNSDASGALEGKIVLVGATAQGMGDRHVVSADGVTQMPGVEAQANLITAIRSDSFVSELDQRSVAALTCFVLLIQFICFWKLPPRTTLLASIALLVVIAAAPVLAVPLGHIWIAPGTAIVVLILAYPLWSWRRLTAVSSFLEAEAQALSQSTEPVDGTDGFDVVARQVGRMKNLVRNVSSSFAFLRQIIEAAPDPILVLKKNGVVDMWNEKAASLFPATDLSEDVHFPELFMNSDIAIDRSVGEVTTTDGRTFLMAKGSFDAELGAGEGGEEGEVIALRDISKIRRQENERREMLEFLSHDMRTPQVAIVGLAQKRAGSINNDDRLARIQVQAERTLKLADDFVQLARLEEADLAFEDTELVSLIQESCDRAFAIARKEGVTIDQPDLEEPVFAEVEASLIARLLDNLIGNAIKFSPKGSTVLIRAAVSGDNTVTLEVADNGPGFPPERQNDPFARFGAHNTKAGPSVGLGLAFVQRAVLKHRGKINVSSSAEGGTRFLITLPERQK